MGIVAEVVLILLIDYTTLGNHIFGTIPLAGSVWLFTIPSALGMLALEELRKCLVRRYPLLTRLLPRLLPAAPPDRISS